MRSHPMPNTIALTLDNPEFRLEKAEYGARCTLNFNNDEANVAIQLSTAALDALIRQGQVLVPHPDTSLPAPQAESACRESAWILKQLDDPSWQLLLREISTDSLIIVLWYLKDRGIAKAVMRNCSLRAAAMLTEDLVNRFHGRDPDKAGQERLKQAHEELFKMLSVIYRLADEGQIEGVLQ